MLEVAHGNGTRLYEVYKELSPESQRVLQALKKSSADGLFTTELAVAANVPSERLKYAVKSITTAMQKYGYPVKAFINTQKDYTGGKTKSKYWMEGTVRLLR